MKGRVGVRMYDMSIIVLVRIKKRLFLFFCIKFFKMKQSNNYSYDFFEKYIVLFGFILILSLFLQKINKHQYSLTY